MAAVIYTPYAARVFIIDNMKDMLGRDNVISAGEALGRLLNCLPGELPAEVGIPIEGSLGRICSRDLLSPEDLPHFARSTVDGYAVSARSTFGATETMPAYLNLSQEVFMGDKADFLVSPMSAAKIPTGGMLPGGTDAVVMFEHVSVLDENTIEVLKPVAPGENVIQAGEDVRIGESLLLRGWRMRPQDIGACAGVGVTKIVVYERPTVSVISTGDEIVAADSTPDSAHIRDINSYVLSAMVSQAGCLPLKRGIFRDNYAEVRSVIELSIAESSAVIISGGTSVGAKDLIAKIINDMGSPGVLFHGVSMKPGKPVIGGMVGGVPVFGLPGHPAAVAVCFDVFIRPVLDRLCGYRERFTGAGRRTVKARLSKNVSSSQGREEHVRVVLEERPDGLWAIPVLGKSGLITTLVKADGTFVIPVNENGVEQREVIEVRLF